MITPAYGLTATERVLPSFVLDWTTGLVQSTVDVTRAGVATVVGSDGLVQSASADTQRIDYSTGVAGLLVEESRTNLVTYSDNYDDASWVHANGVITPDTTNTASPDGTFNADAWVPDSGVGAEVSKSITVAANTNHAASIFVKLKGDAVGIRFECSVSSNGFRGAFNLLTGAVISAFAIGTGAYVAGSAKIEALPNDWYRISLAGVGTTSVGTTTAYRFKLVDAAGNPVVGDGTRGLYIYGSQLEAGAFPTSYIPTTSSAVTRNADVATVTGTNFSDFFNATEGTLFAQFVKNGAVNFQQVAAISNNTSEAVMTLGHGSGAPDTALRFTIVDTTLQANITIADPTDVGAFYKAIGAYKQNSFAAASNGAVPGTDNSGTVPAVDRMYIGSRYDGTSNFLNGVISKTMYWPHRLTNAEIQAFSKKES